jgi:hypothetical protein
MRLPRDVASMLTTAGFSRSATSANDTVVAASADDTAVRPAPSRCG